MKDSTLELISLISIILGLVFCLFFIFDYEPADSFFLEEDDDNAFLDGTINSNIFVEKETRNYSFLKVYSCKSFDAYYEGKITKPANSSIHIRGSFTDNLFIIEHYY